MRLLLINPKYPESFWSFRWAVDEVLPGKRAINPPLGLATLAALCPAHWRVEIVDENVESLPLTTEADIVGVCGMGVQFPRQKQLLAHYRGLGHYVVAGGSFASLCPERYTDLANTVIAGEAERIWPRFCQDFAAGAAQSLYKEEDSLDLDASPVPRYDLLKLSRYTTVTMQFSRGCPYRCEFCDIIVMYGRKPRCKTPEQVGRELDELRRLDVKSVFFVDDNLIGNRPLAKKLLRFLKEYQDRHRYYFQFGTEVSINLAHDRELLELLRAANFTWVFVGIETPDEASLRETKKTQNMQDDLLTSVRRIYAYGIDVLAGFIVGFDNDRAETFDLQYRFIVDSGIQAAMVGLLTALPRTPLYERLQREGRLLERADGSDNTKLSTNVIPKQMSYDTLLTGYKSLYSRLFDDEAIAQRIMNKMRYMTAPNYRGEYTLRERWILLWRLLRKGILRGGTRRLAAFWRTLPLRTPSRIPIVIVDWIAGLAMRDYIERHFAVHYESTPQVARHFEVLRTALAAQINRGWVRLSMFCPNMSSAGISLRFVADFSGHHLAREAAHHVLHFLRSSRGTVTLRFDEIKAESVAEVQAMLSRLNRYADRIVISLSDSAASALSAGLESRLSVRS